jgi:predicted PolB exonuclease-like 3'-5' exonuclease
MPFERTEIVLDIECVAGCDWFQDQQAAKVSAPSNYTKPETIAQWMETTGKAKQEEARRNTCFIPLYSKIICIGFALDDGPVMTIAEDDEKSLIKRFYKELYDAGARSHRYIGHNILNFDLPLLWTRSVVHGVDSAFLPKRQYKAWDTSEVFDTLVQLAGRDTKGYSLGNACRVLGIPDAYPDMDGSMIHDLHKEGMWESIQQYCSNDVCMTRQLFNRIEGYL